MSKRRSVLVLALSFYSVFSFAASAFQPLTPDPSATPGEVCTRTNSDFVEFRYKENIPYCVRNVSHSLKARIYEYYKVPKAARGNYTIDHFIPLSMGGNNEQVNLWPEHKEIKATRQNLEMEVYTDLREGRINQKTAIDKIIKAKMNPPLSLISEFVEYRH